MKIIVISVLIFVSFAASCLASVSDTAWTVTLPENEYVVFAHFSNDDSLISITIYYTNDKEYDPDSAYTSDRNSYTGEEIRKIVSYKSEPEKYVTGYTKPFTDTTYMFKYTNSTTAPYFYIFRMNDKTGQIIDSIPVNVDIPEFRNDTNFVSDHLTSPDGKRFFMKLAIISGYEPNGVKIYEYKLFVWNTENWTIDRSFYFNNGILIGISPNNKYYCCYLTKQNAYSFFDINNDSTLYKLVDNDSIHYDDVIFPKKDTNKFLVIYRDKIDSRNKIQVRSQSDFSIIKTIVNDTICENPILFLKGTDYLLSKAGSIAEGIKGLRVIYDIENELIVYVIPKFPSILGQYGPNSLIASNNSELIFDGFSRTLRMYNAKYTTTSTKEQDKENPGLIFPNPAEDYIEISVGAQGTVPDGVSIFDVLGIEVLKSMDSRFRGNDSQFPEGTIRIDISSLSPGVYFVRIGDVVRKFVKM